MDKILSELLDYSKPLELEKTSIDLEGVINDIYNLVKPAFDDNNVGLKIKYKVSQDIQVTFDRVRVHQALLNVVKNALEVSPPGKSVFLNVDCRSTDGTVYIKISDQGSGITEEAMKKLFTPYFTTKTSGTGLGLAQARKIMKAHNGEIEVLSSSSDGTTFALILPGKYSPLLNIESS